MPRFYTRASRTRIYIVLSNTHILYLYNLTTVYDVEDI